MESRPLAAARGCPTAVRWVKQWVPQDLATTGGKCQLFKWVREGMLAPEDKSEEPFAEEQRPEPRTETLFLCSYVGCGKVFIDFQALKKHAHIHGQRLYVCQYEGCGKKFLDSSKLKRHNLIHTGEKHFVCPHEGCGKAFSLDFNLKSHMKTHSLENYHVCPYPECGRKFVMESKLKSHVKAQHEKKTLEMNLLKLNSSIEKARNTPKLATATYQSTSVARPFACPYEGCEKAYIHEYKLNLHLRKEHHEHYSTGKPPRASDNLMDDPSNQDTCIAGGDGGGENSKKWMSEKRKPDQIPTMPPAKFPKGNGSNEVLSGINSIKKHFPRKEMDKEDGEETTQEDCDALQQEYMECGWKECGWKDQQMDDGEETEDGE